MHDAASPVLTAWSNFYVIAGSSAAALTGLMFVVITLVAGHHSEVKNDGMSTFSTPTVVHFCMALLVSTILSAPWRSPAHAGVMLGIAGLFGLGYVLRVTFRARNLTTYRLDLEEWVWYTILPLIAYLTIAVVAVLLRTVAVEALFALAGAAMLLILIGIHNAWDIVTYLAIGYLDRPPSTSKEETTP